MPLFFITFAIPVQAKQLGGTAVEIGALFSLFTVSLLLLRPIVGLSLDRFGRKPFVVVALGIYAIANVTYAFAADISDMYVARVLQGFGAAFLLLAVDTITADLTDPAGRPLAMGRNMETQTRSSIVGATIGFTLLGAMPLVAWRYSFGLFAVVCLAAVFIAFIRLPESKPASIAGESPRLKRNLEFRKLLLVIFLASFGSALIQPIYLIYIQDQFTLPLYMLSWAFLPAGIVFAVLPAKLSKLNQRFGLVRVVVFGLVVPGVAYLVLPGLPTFAGLVVVYTLASVGWAIFEPARKTMTASQATSESRGRVFGITELYAGTGASLGPIIGGYLYDTMPAPVVFYFDGGLLLATALLAWITLKGVPKPA